MPWTSVSWGKVLPPQGKATVASYRCRIALLLLSDRLQAALLGAQ